MYVSAQLGRYHLLDRIACGGMAEIFRAKTFDPQGNEHLVAIKRVLSHLAEDDAFVQMLVDEAKIASLLAHPNIARVYEFARSGDTYFLAMEYVDGKDLRSIIDRCRAEGVQLSAEHAAYIMSCVLDALHAAHTCADASGRPLQIVHRDVSPSNVIVAYDGQIKLCDFGIAKATLSRVETRAGVVKGKVRYMSPEQTRGLKLDGRSDLFSAGSVLYELLTRHPAFSANSEMELVLKVREAKYANPTLHKPDIPQPLLRTLRRALARTAQARFRDAAEFAEQLRDYLRQQAPDYAPNHLGRLLRSLFADDIERDLRKMEQYVLGQPDPDDLGDNLSHPDHRAQRAAYSKFTPVYPRALAEQRTHEPSDRAEGAEQAASVAPSAAFHDATTQLHDLDDPRRLAPPGQRGGESRGRRRGQGQRREGAERERQREGPPEGDGLHHAKTKILSRD